MEIGPALLDLHSIGSDISTLRRFLENAEVRSISSERNDDVVYRYIQNKDSAFDEL